jgi:DNA adenine methylase
MEHHKSAKHIDLAVQLKNVQGFVVISGYACKLYDEELYPTWHRVEKSHRADGARLRTEVLWINDAAWKMRAGLFNGHAS